MTSKLARSLVVLFVLAMVPGWIGLFWNLHTEHAEQAAQARAGQQVERKLCTTLIPLEPLAGLTPPAGNPATNPSRAYEQHLTLLLQPLAQLGPDLGCKETP